MLQIGPLTNLVYKDSISYRGEYWRAGIKMGLDHPFSGVGWDSYGDWYRRARSASAIISPGADVTTNSAHNVFIDVFASGGFPMLASYLFVQVFVAIKIARHLFVTQKFEPIFVGVSSIWIGYTAQSVISINQLGLAVWGWVSGGLVLCIIHLSSRDEILEVPAKNVELSSHSKGGKSNQSTSFDITDFTKPTAFIGAIVGLIIAGIPMYADSVWRSSFNTQKQEAIETAIVQWPLNATRLINGSNIFIDNSLNEPAIKYARLAVKEFPDDYYAWNNLYRMPLSTQKEKFLALNQLRRLDPLNPNVGTD
jgi:hypothetical protein